MKTPNLLSASLMKVSLSYFFFSISFLLITVVMSAYAMDTFQASPAEAGLASSVFVVGSLASRLLFGRWIEKIGQKRIFCLGLTASLLITLLYFVANNLLLLFGVRFLQGLAFGITTSTAGTIAANLIPQGRRGEGLGYFGLSVTLGMAIGPFLGMFIYQHGTHEMVFGTSTLAAAIALVLGTLTRPSEVKLTLSQTADLKGFKLRNFLEPRAIPISIFLTVIVICYSSVMTFLIPYAREIDLMDSASYFFIVYSMVVLFSRPLVGHLFDLKGANLIIYPAVLIFSAAMLMVSQSRSGFVLLLSGALIGLSMGSMQSNVQAIAMQVSPQHRLGLANSTYFIFLDLGVAIGPFLFGVLLPFAGYRTMYAFSAALALLCVFLYYYLHGKKAPGLKVGPVSR